MQLITLVFFACVASITLACRCGKTDDQKLNDADFIIRASVEEETHVTRSLGNYYKYLITIMQKEKWMTVKEVTECYLVTPESGSLCGGQLTIGSQYRLAGSFQNITGSITMAEMHLGFCKFVKEVILKKKI